MVYPELQKIDPNTQVVTEDSITPAEHLFSQAAIPAISAALYKFSQADAGAEALLHPNGNENWIDFLFLDNMKEVIQKIASYSLKSMEETEIKLNTIAVVAVSLINEQITPAGTIYDLKKYLAGERSNILLYLPAALQMGEMLNDNTLDDRTNKMEGPVSSLMHAIGSRFSDGDAEKEGSLGN